MFQRFISVRKCKGFTLVETLVAISIFTIVMGISISLFVNTHASSTRTKVSRMLYEETRIALERIAKEVRGGTIDYEEYWSWHREGTTDYGENYGEYAAEFFGVDTKAEVNRSSENIGQGRDAIVFISGSSSAHEQKELYLINSNGTKKTIIKKQDFSGEDRLVMMRMSGTDTDGDTISDSWVPMADYITTNFQKIQPDSIRITDLKFFIAPLKDPRKAFAEFENAVQIQPHVTILITAEPSASEVVGIRGKTPSITLQTTVSARAQNEVKSLK